MCACFCFFVLLLLLLLLFWGVIYGHLEDTETGPILGDYPDRGEGGKLKNRGTLGCGGWGSEVEFTA